jgi:hypothetical protein
MADAGEYPSDTRFAVSTNRSDLGMGDNRGWFLEAFVYGAEYLEQLNRRQEALQDRIGRDDRTSRVNSVDAIERNYSGVCRRYPTNGSVNKNFGSRGEASIFFLNRLTKTRRYFLSSTCSEPHTSLSSSL